MKISFGGAGLNMRGLDDIIRKEKLFQRHSMLFYFETETLSLECCMIKNHLKEGEQRVKVKRT